MGTWPLGGGQRAETAGALSASSEGTFLPAESPAHEKTDWVQLLASTFFDAAGMLIFVGLDGGGDMKKTMVDIGIGGAGSEKVIVPNLWSNRNDFQNGFNIYVPIPVPAGSRLAARHQSESTDGSRGVRVTVTLLGQGFSPSQPLALVRDYGAVLASTAGTAVDPGGVAHTKGSWAQLAASVTEDIRQFFLIRGQIGSGAVAETSWLYDVGVGAASFEQVIVPDLLYCADDSANLYMPDVVGPFPCQIPKGSRVSMRAQCPITDPTNRNAQFIFYGIS